MTSLSDRLLQHLREHGPQTTQALQAQALAWGEDPELVSGLIYQLAWRHLVESRTVSLSDYERTLEWTARGEGA